MKNIYKPYTAVNKLIEALNALKNQENAENSTESINNNSA